MGDARGILGGGANAELIPVCGRRRVFTAEGRRGSQSWG